MHDHRYELVLRIVGCNDLADWLGLDVRNCATYISQLSNGEVLRTANPMLCSVVEFDQERAASVTFIARKRQRRLRSATF